MSERIPKPVRDVLAKQTAAEPHPSPDLLNGYVEQSLTAAEKDPVAQHLARCEECREVVFLAGGVAEEELATPLVAAAQPPYTQVPAPVFAAKAPATGETGKIKRQRAWPWWKWAAPVAAVVIFAGGAFIERDRIVTLFSPEQVEVAGAMRQAPAPTHAAKAPPSTAAPSQAQEESKPQTPSSEAIHNSVEVEQQKKATAMYAYKEAPSARAEITGKDSGGRRDERLTAGLFTAQPSAAPQAQAAVGGRVGVSPAAPPAAPAVAAKSAAPPSASQTVEGSSAAPLVQADNSDLSTAAADALKPNSLAKSSLVANNEPQGQGMLGATASPRALVHPLWRITPDGRLERSLKAGTWATVLASEPTVFRVVSKIGTSVWAGGDNGALYHSTDRGEHWNKVALSESGEIISIEFTSPELGRVTTASGSVWKTSDGGHTWSKQ